MKNAREYMIIALGIAIVLWCVQHAENYRQVAPRNEVKDVKIQPVKREEPKLSLMETKKVEQEKIQLSDKNTVTLRGVVTDQSVGEAQKLLMEKSRHLSKHDVIYLVLDTPGGSIEAGNMLIETVKGLPQKVNTISIFAASMGFQIAEHLDTRYIIASGTLMSHLAAGGAQGTMRGSLQQRVNYFSQMIDILEQEDADRIQISLEDYRKKIQNEWWMYGKNAVEENTADKVAIVSCDESMDGETKIMMDTIIGPIMVGFSKCPLRQYPTSINFEAKITKEDRQKGLEYVHEMFYDKKLFVEDFIVGDNKRGLIVFNK